MESLSIDLVKNNLNNPKVDLNKNKIIINDAFLQGNDHYIHNSVYGIDYNKLFDTTIHNKNTNNTNNNTNTNNTYTNNKNTNNTNNNKQREIVKNETIPELDAFINEMCPDSYTVNTIVLKNSFISSICMILDKPSFIISNYLSKINTVAELKNKLAYDLDEKNLYKLYNLKEVSKFKKSDLQKNILQIENDDVIDYSITSYISHIFNCNIIIIYFKDKKYVHANVYDDTKDTLIYIVYDVTFYILCNNENNNKFNDSFIKNKITENVHFKYIDQSLLKFYIHGLKYDNLNIKKSAKLADIQSIAKIFDIQLLKSNGKNKSISDLLEEMQSVSLQLYI
jgi:hypothetical protein